MTVACPEDAHELVGVGRSIFTSDEGRKWLWRRIMDTDRLRRRFCDSKGGWRPAAIRAIEMGTFLEKLLVLAHLTGGQPGRAPELRSVRHSNAARRVRG